MYMKREREREGIKEEKGPLILQIIALQHMGVALFV